MCLPSRRDFGNANIFARRDKIFPRQAETIGIGRFKRFAFTHTYVRSRAREEDKRRNRSNDFSIMERYRPHCCCTVARQILVISPRFAGIRGRVVTPRPCSRCSTFPRPFGRPKREKDTYVPSAERSRRVGRSVLMAFCIHIARLGMRQQLVAFHLHHFLLRRQPVRERRVRLDRGQMGQEDGFLRDTLLRGDILDRHQLQPQLCHLHCAEDRQRSVLSCHLSDTFHIG